jgi:hypothetical protein
MEINSLVLNMRQIKLKENSDLTTQNRNLVYVLSFVTVYYLYHKSPKTKTGCFTNTTTAKSQ